MALKFYNDLAKELKLKVRTFLGLIPTFVEVTGEKLVEWGHLESPPYHPEQSQHINHIVTQLNVFVKYCYSIPLQQ